MKNYPCALLGFIVAASSAFAATVPYSDNFQAGTVTEWTSGGGAPATWGIVNTGTSNVYQVTSSASAGNFTSVVQLTNATSALQSFTMTSSFKITDGSAGEFIGFAAFSNNITPGFGSNYVADIASGGQMRIIAQNDTSGFSSTAATFATSLVVGTNYTMSLTSTYVGGTLNMTFTLTNGTQSQSVTATDTSPLTGTYFGYRLNNSTDSLVTQFSNFTVTTSPIPEPASAAMLLGLGALGAVGTVRRRRVR
ncbi:MAG: PEP-CTERM sorting domain-containing protein [Rariglobus sp.]